MEENVLEKMTIFDHISHFLNRIFKKETPVRETPLYSNSRFQQFVVYMPPDDPMYEKTSNAASLCDEALRVARQRIVLVSRIKAIEENLNELECFFRLNEEDAKQLKNLLDRFVSLTVERNVLLYQLTDFDRTLSRMMDIEAEANSAVPNIQEAEQKQRVLKQDIGYLEGEKAELIYERALLESGMVFINRFAIGAVVLFGLVAMFLGYLFMAREQAIFLPTTVLVLLAIVVTVLLYMFDKRIRYELKVNLKKQQRAVELLNKKNVVCVYYTNFLKYEYGKYKVRNSQMLKSNLSDYKHYKHISARIDAIRKIMYETETEIEKFLKAKDINYSKYSIEQFAKTVNIADKIEFSKEIANDKSVLEKNLLELDEKHAAVWDLIESINEQDESEDKVIGQMIQAYFDEVSKMLFSIDKEEEAV